ncbi:hypothetical protein BIV57_08930 [Mangrovactinospora gilvigrisea]|uniref:Thiamine-binding protein domain-containing protein n=1 Tax=Mangrovactinospora gilvigrisea TaxID=1428644 RepID=A0A1J7BW52_9ACTN|nr:hypothetical protein [Mangrovactinospora gilvigrisea]OIV37697.1 hypothetical protein BIV57_08930 [Mangrovactinospora gilvigrisea]
MRLKVEFSTEPFDMDGPPDHALAAREVVAGLEKVDIGPFGNTAEGPDGAVLDAVAALYRRALAAGADRVTVQLTVVPDAGSADGGARA